MDRELDVLTLLLLDPCLTTDEATREAAAANGRSRPEAAAPHPAEPLEMRTSRRFSAPAPAYPGAAV